MPKRNKGTRHTGRRRSKSRRRSLALALISAIVLAVLGVAGEWFVHHPRRWLDQKTAELPWLVSTTLFVFGNPLADITDALDLTGHDAVYDYDTEAPSGSVAFAGFPVRTGNPAPPDIRIIERGEFAIGWSDTLRHPVWCAYHVEKDDRHPVGKRPSFLKDRDIFRAPSPDAYKKSGYDRGHMVPNYAIATRYGDDEQRKTFMMGNIAPQSASLNRGVWREFEHRIAELWTARWGEIWVVVGCIPSQSGQKLAGSDIDLPERFYQVILSQEGMDVRALAVLFDRDESWDTWAARRLVTIDELETLTGLDFNPELPSFIQDPLEADLPTRLWPICKWHVFKQIAIRFLR